MDKPRQPLAPFDALLFRLAAFFGAVAFVGRVVAAFVTGRPLVAVFGAGAFAAGICYLVALLYITRRM